VNDFDFEWVRFLGAEPIDAADGRCVMRLDPRPVHLNHNQTVNAPVLYGLAEVAGAGAVAAGMMDLLATAYIVVKHASIDYLAPARGAVTATGVVAPSAFAAAKESVAAATPVDVDAEVSVVDADGRPTTTVTLTMSIRPRRK